MLLRRALYAVQVFPAVLLPVWVLITRGILADGLGWAFVVYLIVCPVLFAALLLTSSLIFARRSVRVAKAVSWLDAATLGAVWLSVFSYGLFAIPLLGVVVVLAVLAGFWVVAAQLVAETRQRVTGYFDGAARQIPDVIVVPVDRVSR